MDEKENITIDRVAELAYVSRSVVSRVLNDHPNVSEEARARVEAVIEEYDYRPSSVARSLATDRTFEIGVLMPRRQTEAISTGYWPLLQSGIFERCLERGYLVSLSVVSEELEDKISECIVSDRRFDGYIFITQEVTDQIGDSLQKRDAPAVLIGRDTTGEQLNSVDVDNVQAAYIAAAHICAQGYETVGAILGDRSLKETDDRLKGFKQALREADIAVDKDWVQTGDYAQGSGYHIMNAWIEEATPRAVFCASDTIAMGALLAVHEAGLDVPGDVAIVGFDDLPFSAYTCPPLTTVHQPIYEKGECAADLLIDQIESDNPDVVRTDLEAELVVRASCGAR